MKTATYGVLLLATLATALLVVGALREPVPVPATYVAPAPLPSEPGAGSSTATRIEAIDRAAALKLAAQSRADKAVMAIIAEGADAWPR